MQEMGHSSWRVDDVWQRLNFSEESSNWKQNQKNQKRGIKTEAVERFELPSRASVIAFPMSSSQTLKPVVGVEAVWVAVGQFSLAASVKRHKTNLEIWIWQNTEMSVAITENKIHYKDEGNTQLLHLVRLLLT